jgi:hypothetical protein
LKENSYFFFLHFLSNLLALRHSIYLLAKVEVQALSPSMCQE